MLGSKKFEKIACELISILKIITQELSFYATEYLITEIIN